MTLELLTGVDIDMQAIGDHHGDSANGKVKATEKPSTASPSKKKCKGGRH